MYWKIILYISHIIAFTVTFTGIKHNNKPVTIGGIIAMAVCTGLAFYMGAAYG